MGSGDGVALAAGVEVGRVAVGAGVVTRGASGVVTLPWATAVAVNSTGLT